MSILPKATIAVIGGTELGNAYVEIPGYPL